MNAGLLVVVLLLVVVVAALFWPLRAGRAPGQSSAEPAVGLEIARDAKLGELHDLELDFRIGKLSPEDYRRLNETLRSEAVETIRLLDATSTNGRRPRR